MKYYGVLSSVVEVIMASSSGQIVSIYDARSPRYLRNHCLRVRLLRMPLPVRFTSSQMPN